MINILRLKLLLSVLIFSVCSLSLTYAEVGTGFGEDVKPSTLYDKEGQVLPDDPNDPRVHWTRMGKEGNSAWRSVGQLSVDGGKCTTTVFQIPQCHDPKRKAQVITNGHCAKPNPSVTFDMFHNTDPKSRVTARVRRSLYAAANRTDIAIFELDQSYQELEKKGIEAKRIAKTPLHKDKTYDLVGVPVEGMKSDHALYSSQCQIGQRVPLMDREKFWPEAVEFSGCSSVGGSSGSGLFRNDELVGILNSGNLKSNLDRKDPCDIGTCTYGSDGEPQHKMLNFGFDVTGLHKCYESCTLNTKLKGCPLPDAGTEFEIAADHADEKNWTESLDRQYIVKPPAGSYQVKVCAPGTGCNCQDPSGYGPSKAHMKQGSRHFFKPSAYLPQAPVKLNQGDKTKLYLFCFRGVRPDGSLDEAKNITSYPLYHRAPRAGMPLKPGGSLPGWIQK